MKNIILFGCKEDFAIQLGLHTNLEKCKLCFWVQRKKMGSFTKGGELKYSIKAYKIFSSNKESYYQSIFENMPPATIRKYFVDDMFALGRSNKKEKKEEYEKRDKLRLFFGPQFTNDGCFIRLLYNENNVIFIYEPPKTLKADKYITGYENFCKVFDEYIEYCNKNKLA